MEEANRLPLLSSRDDDSVDEEEFPEEFRVLLHTKLNSSRLEDYVDEAHVTVRVFWSRQDDILSTVPPSVSDRENANIVPDCSPKVKDKIRLALGKILLHPLYGQSLVQFWAALEIEGRTLLTTQNQPFALGNTGRSTWWLYQYRMKSMDQNFYGDIGEGGDEELGVPGRVFLNKLPESAPDVGYYPLKEFPQRDDASHCQVRLSWALPVFEHSSQVCVGVLELVSAVSAITDWHDISFLHNLCNVLQELGLQSVDLQSVDVGRRYEMEELGLQSVDVHRPYEISVDPSIPLQELDLQSVDVLGHYGMEMSSLIGVDPSTTKTERTLKKTGDKFDISLDDVLRFSAFSRKDAARKLKVSISTFTRVCRKHGINQWPPQDINKDVGSDLCQPSRSFIGAELSNSDVTSPDDETITTQKRIEGKTGVRIEISLEKILQCSSMKRDDAARELNVCPSTLKRICRGYGINRWPPCKIDMVGAPQPSRDIPTLNMDKVGATRNGCGVLQEDNAASREMEMVTFKAKYNNHMIKFHLSISSGMQELRQQVSLRLEQLNLKAENYFIQYKDEEGDLISIACNEDICDCIHTSRSMGNTIVPIVIIPCSK